MQRLAELTRDGMTSSFLTAPDALVAAGEELVAVGQVIGASACRLAVGVVRRTRGPQGRLPVGSAAWREHDGPVRSWNHARQRALGRLSSQARVLGADAVLGVHADFRVRAADPETAEVVMTGTAVRDRHVESARREDPVLGLVSVAEFGLLRRAGVRVVGIVGSCSNVDIGAGAETRRALGGRFLGSAVNQELGDLTTGVYEARRLAVERLRRDASRLDATGVLGVDLSGSWPSTRARSRRWG